MTPLPRAPYREVRLYDRERTPAPVDLSDNTNLWGPHPGAVRVLRRAPGTALCRYPDPYARALKEAAASRWDVPPDAVVTGCGSDDLLDSAFRAAADPGEAVAFPVPTFSLIPTLARVNGLRPLPVPAVGDPADLADALLRGGPAVVYLCRPNNPTGDLGGHRVVEELLAGTDGPLVVVDEAYADFAGETLLPAAAGHPRLLVVRTLSKAYGLAGLRVAFAVGSPDVVREVEKSRGPYKVGRLAEAAAVAALRDREEWVPRVADEVRRSRAFLARALTERGLPPLPSAANFLFVPVPDARALAAALRDRGFAVRPFPGLPLVGDGIRVTVAPRPLLETFLAALDHAVEARGRTAGNPEGEGPTRDRPGAGDPEGGGGA